MALISTEIKRVFIMKKNGKDINLDDPNPEFTADEVLEFYSNVHPELTTYTVAGPELKNDEQHYTFKTTVGTKG